MARPFTATDDDILNAAGKVIARRGPDGFSISEVAADVGLSRAAIILRFKSTHALKVTLLTRMVEQFANALQSLPQTPSGDNILRLSGFIGGYVRSRDSLTSFFSTYSTNLQHPDLLALELKRGQALRAAISSVMPEVEIDHASAVTAFSAHLTGTIMAWLAADDESSRHYLVKRTRDWLVLTGIPFREEVLAELVAEPLGGQGGPERPSAQRGKQHKRPSRRPARGS
jgi:AcrR family transcriptional regulator